MNTTTSYHQQYTFCGKTNCNPCRNGKGHGPYWYAYSQKNGQITRKYVGKHLPSHASVPLQVREKPGAALEILTKNYPVEREEVNPSVRVWLLGPLRLERATSQGWQVVTDPVWQLRSVRLLLVSLLCSPERRMAREQAMELLWPEQESKKATSRLNHTVYQLRQLLDRQPACTVGDHLLRMKHNVLSLAGQEEVWSDLDAFEHSTHQATITEDIQQKKQFLNEAYRLYQGTLCMEEGNSDYLLIPRHTLQRRWIGIVLDLVDDYVEEKRYTDAIPLLEKLLSVDPAHEAGARRLMLILIHLHRRSEATHVYQQLTEALQQTYGMTALAETHALYESLCQEAQNALSIRKVTSTLHSLSQWKPLSYMFTAAQPFMCIGRERELAILRRILHLPEERRTKKITSLRNTPQETIHMILLAGEIGVGKTRIAEILAHQALKENWMVCWKSQYEYESGISYSLWRGIVATLLSMLVQRDHEYAQALAPHLAPLLPELATYLPLNVYLPVQQTPEPACLWENLYRLLVASSQHAPLLLVLDNLQWADKSSLDLLAFFSRFCSTQHIFLLGLCRDADYASLSSLNTLVHDLQREQRGLLLSIQPLMDEHSDVLLGVLPREVKQQIRYLAAGHPYFLKELAHAARQKPISWENSLPEDICSTLYRRLSVSQACQRLLERAALYGSTFSLHHLAQLATGEQSEDVVISCLEEALHARLLVEERVGQGILYHFRIPLFAVYLVGRLSSARRALWQRQLAEEALPCCHNGI